MLFSSGDAVSLQEYSALYVTCSALCILAGLHPLTLVQIARCLRVHAPVDDVEEQVGQWEESTGVRVDHVAVAHDEAEVPPHRPFPA